MSFVQVCRAGNPSSHNVGRRHPRSDAANSALLLRLAGDVLGCVAPSVMKALRGESLAWLIRRHEIDWRNSHAHLVRQCRVFSVAGIRCSTALIAFLVFF